jgi:hypothetical protein
LQGGNKNKIFQTFPVLFFPHQNNRFWGFKGDKPRAISYAFTNSIVSKVSGKRLNAAVVFPAPIGPPLIYKKRY